MKVALYYNNNDIRIEEMPRPQLCDGEILVQVKASGICGTDVLEWYRLPKAPRIMGHEISGDIVESKSKKYKVGQRVFVSHHVPCNNCKYCNEGSHTACETLHKGNFYPGGYSEFVRVPKLNVDTGIYVLAPDFSYEEATMIEPLACAIRAIRIINLKPNQTALILGCGVSGLLNISLAKLKGAKVIAADINEYRLNKAKEFGADRTINAEQDFNVTADRIIVCTGAADAAKKAFECIDRKGIILFFAIPKEKIEIPSVDFWRNEITVTSSYGAAPLDLKQAYELIMDKKINAAGLITHKLSLQDIQKGFKIVSEANESLKVVLTL